MMRQPGSVLAAIGVREEARFMEQALVASGLSVRVCHDATTAMAAACEATPDVALISLPEGGGGDGLRLGMELRALDPGIGLILVTPGQSERSAANALRSGFDDYLITPVGERELTSAVLDVLARSLARRAESEAGRAHEAIAEMPRADEALAGARALAAATEAELRSVVGLAHSAATETARETGAGAAMATAALIQWAAEVGLVADRLFLIARPALKPLSYLSVADHVSRVVALVEPHATRLGVALSTEVPEDIPRVWADPLAFRAILVELAANACRAAHGTRGAKLSIRAACEDNEVRIEVADNGIGTHEAETQALAEPFVSARFGPRAGLGLHACREALRAMHGDLQLLAGDPSGWRAIVVLPTRAPAAEDVP